MSDLLEAYVALMVVHRIEHNIGSFLSTGGRESTEAGENIVIKDLLITDGKLKYALVGDKTLELQLPELHLTNIGESGQGLSMAEASAKNYCCYLQRRQQNCVELRLVERYR
mgnify:CR=1 FL=1